MKLEVGMYARTKKGIIDKIIDITEEDHQRGEDEGLKPYKIYEIKQVVYDDEFDEYSNWLFAEQFIKASHNIIDLIEVGDYVNGEKVININGTLYVNNEGALEDIVIKSIVTCEQFSSMEYRIGE